MTNKQRIYIDTAVSTMNDAVRFGGKNVPFGSIDEMTRALGGATGCPEVFMAAGLELTDVIAVSAMRMGAIDSIPLLMELLQMFFWIGYDLGHIGAFDEMVDAVPGNLQALIDEGFYPPSGEVSEGDGEG